MLDFTITKRKLSSFIALLAFLQAGLWYGGLADLIPVALLNQWNRLTLIFSVILAFLCIARKRKINIATTLIVLFKVILILSTYINGRTVDEVEFTRFLCIVLSLEYFEDELDLSWEGCGRGRKQLKCCRVVMMNSISGSVSLLFKDTGSRRYLDCRFPIRSRPGGMGN